MGWSMQPITSCGDIHLGRLLRLALEQTEMETGSWIRWTTMSGGGTSVRHHPDLERSQMQRQRLPASPNPCIRRKIYCRTQLLPLNKARAQVLTRKLVLPGRGRSFP